jgi:DNA processing protein
VIIPPHDPAYPRHLLELDEPPVITVSGPVSETPLDGHRVVAIVGSRQAQSDALNWTHQLAYHLAHAGVVVLSGGAAGVDWAAHTGALKAGRTWCVACTGCDARPFPPRHRKLFDRIASSPGSRMIWPFPATIAKTNLTPRRRNRVLTALADVIVVVQARIASGSLNAASNADRLGRPLYVVTGRPWDYPFLGSAKLILEGAAPLVSIEQLFRDLELPEPNIDEPEAILCDRAPRQPPIRAFKRRGRSLAPAPLFRVDPSTLPAGEREVFSCLSNAPLHQDKIVAKAGLGASTTLTALLTLSLRDVVVEGPDGFFRLRTEP